jgi:hypothetical protein
MGGATAQTVGPEAAQAEPAADAAAAVLAPAGGEAAALLSLQRTAGNRATAALLHAGGRAGTVRARSRKDARADELTTAQLQRAVLRRPSRPAPPGKVVLAEIPISSSIDLPAAMVQRQPTGETPGCDPASSSCAAPSASGAPIKRVSNQSIAPVAVDAGTAREIVDTYVAGFANVPGAVRIPWSSPQAVASNEPPSNAGPSIATWPATRMIARSPGLDYHFQGGFVGSLQLCYDLCTAELGLIGWVWAGGGVEADYGLLGGKQWWGAYVYAEKDFGKTTLDFMPKLSCGKCDPACTPTEHGDTHWGSGVAGFPIVLTPGERKQFKAAGVEVGALITPTTACSAVFEVIALIDITQYIPPPYGPAIRYAFDTASKFAERFNIKLECGAGFDLSGSVNLCTSVPGGGIGGITADSAKICAGGYAACNVGLSHNKSQLPGKH